MLVQESVSVLQMDIRRPSLCNTNDWQWDANCPEFFTTHRGVPYGLHSYCIFSEDWAIGKTALVRLRFGISLTTSYESQVFNLHVFPLCELWIKNLEVFSKFTKWNLMTKLFSLCELWHILKFSFQSSQSGSESFTAFHFVNFVLSQNLPIQSSGF